MINSYDPSPEIRRILDEVFGNPFAEILPTPVDNQPVRLKNIEVIKDGIAALARGADAASRRVLLSSRNGASLKTFERLVTEMPQGHRLLARAERLWETGGSSEPDEVLHKEADTWIKRASYFLSADSIGERCVPLAERVREVYGMHHREFEHFIAQMLNLDGFMVERWNGGAGDLAADLIVRLPGPDGRRAIVQCKHVQNRDTAIGSGVVQQVSGTAGVHDAELAFVVTTGRMTKPASALAQRLGVLCVDRDALIQWAVMGERVLDLLADVKQWDEAAAPWRLRHAVEPESPVAQH